MDLKSLAKAILKEAPKTKSVPPIPADQLALVLVLESGEMTIKELVEFFQIPLSTLLGIVSRAEKNKRVIRFKKDPSTESKLNAKKSRATYVRLTSVAMQERKRKQNIIKEMKK